MCPIMKVLNIYDLWDTSVCNMLRKLNATLWTVTGSTSRKQPPNHRIKRPYFYNMSTSPSIYCIRWLSLYTTFIQFNKQLDVVGGAADYSEQDYLGLSYALWYTICMPKCTGQGYSLHHHKLSHLQNEENKLKCLESPLDSNKIISGKIT